MATAPPSQPVPPQAAVGAQAGATTPPTAPPQGAPPRAGVQATGQTPQPAANTASDPMMAHQCPMTLSQMKVRRHVGDGKIPLAGLWTAHASGHGAPKRLTRVVLYDVRLHLTVMSHGPKCG
eukprot:Sspe_Gene.108248::Locus_87403_Transcript_2_3_Confidence_0.778_Length_445::g.108248::m.108248